MFSIELLFDFNKESNKSPSHKARKKTKKLKHDNLISKSEKKKEKREKSVKTTPKSDKKALNNSSSSSAKKSSPPLTLNNSATNVLNSTSSKCLDRNVLNTLNIMHKQAIKASLIGIWLCCCCCSLIRALFNFSILGTSNCSTKSSDDTVGSNDYNVKAMTKMINTNIDCKLLKDCSIMDLGEFDVREQLGPEVSNAVDDYLSKLKILFLAINSN